MKNKDASPAPKNERQPNTQYILSLSYGKDSIAALEAITQLGYPLDRIVHAEIMATDTIPADLPPMMEFKEKADKIIKERYGIEVEHVCATRKIGGGVENPSHTNDNSIKSDSKDDPTEDSTSTDSHPTAPLGVIPILKENLSPGYEILTYEKLFYHIPARKPKDQTRQPERKKGGQCEHSKECLSDSPSARDGVHRDSSRIHCAIFGTAPRAGREDKYRSVSWNSSR